MKNSSIVKRLVSSDGETKKFLFKLNDGQTIESVLMKCNMDILFVYPAKLDVKWAVLFA